MNIIETDRLILRRWHVDDYLDMYEFNSDENVNLCAGCNVIKDIDTIKNNLSNLISSNQSYAIVLKSENKVIGTIGLDEICIDERFKHLKQFYIGYRLNSNYWGNGYATEVAKHFINYLFDSLNADLIWASHYDFNTKSKRVIEKCGLNYSFSKNVKIKVLDNKNSTELFYNISRISL